VVIEYLGDILFPCFGVPQIVVSDNGTQFNSHEFADFLLKHGIQDLCTGAYAQQSNVAEWVNRSINAALRSCVRKDQREWDTFHGTINCALRNSIHQSVGMVPYFIVFGQLLITHGEDYKLLKTLGILIESITRLIREDEFSKLRSDIGKNLEKAYMKIQHTYNLRSRPRTFDIGDEVIKRNFQLSNLAFHFNVKLAPVEIKAIWEISTRKIFGKHNSIFCITLSQLLPLPVR